MLAANPIQAGDELFLDQANASQFLNKNGDTIVYLAEKMAKKLTELKAKGYKIKSAKASHMSCFGTPNKTKALVAWCCQFCIWRRVRRAKDFGAAKSYVTHTPTQSDSTTFPLPRTQCPVLTPSLPSPAALLPRLPTRLSLPSFVKHPLAFGLNCIKSHPNGEHAITHQATIILKHASKSSPPKIAPPTNCKSA
ncbi:MAG: hypothetical protein IPP17_23490 [Bacteroidetes bacterium]|nr:hypothetical protein [Bacteroidota bacterium]